MVPPRARTAETYIAGIGASGALIASAFVMLVVLVGIVTFDAWPRGGNQAGGGDGQVSLSTTTPTAETINPNASNLVKIFNAGSAAVAASAGARHHAASQGSPGTQGTLEGGTGTQPGNQAPVESPQPPTSGGGPTGVVDRTVSGLGNTVEGTTDSAGNVLGGSSGPGVGGVVGGLGHTVNGTLQGLVGNSSVQELLGSH
jgi:hypothetical protein